MITRELSGIRNRDMPGVQHRAISIINDPATGHAQVVTDQEGAHVSVSEGEGGAMLLTEILSDGNYGQQVSVDLVVIPPAE